MLVNWTDLLDGEIVSAVGAVARMAAKPRVSRRVEKDLAIATWTDTERLTGDALEGIAADPGIPELAGEELAELANALRQHEVQRRLTSFQISCCSLKNTRSLPSSRSAACVVTM